MRMFSPASILNTVIMDVEDLMGLDFRLMNSEGELETVMIQIGEGSSGLMMDLCILMLLLKYLMKEK
jgi:hypothetical protein